MQKLRLPTRQVTDPICVPCATPGSSAQILSMATMALRAAGDFTRSISAGFIFSVGGGTAGGPGMLAASFFGELLTYAMCTSSQTRFHDTPLLSSTAIQPPGPTY